MNNLKPYKLSAQLKAELHHKRSSSTPFVRSNFSFNFKKIPFKGIGLVLGVFSFIIISYLGAKSVYEYSATKNQVAKQTQIENYEKHLERINNEVATLATDAKGFVTLSQDFLKSKEIEKAEAAAKFSIEKDPLWRDAYMNQGHVMLVANKFEQAKTSFEKALEIDPLCGQAHYFLSLSYQELKNNEAAKKAFAKAKQFGFETEIGG